MKVIRYMKAIDAIFIGSSISIIKNILKRVITIKINGCRSNKNALYHDLFKIELNSKI